MTSPEKKNYLIPTSILRTHRDKLYCIDEMKIVQNMWNTIPPPPPPPPPLLPIHQYEGTHNLHTYFSYIYTIHITTFPLTSERMTTALLIINTTRTDKMSYCVQE